jgi:hypothetical protein
MSRCEVWLGELVRATVLLRCLLGTASPQRNILQSKKACKQALACPDNIRNALQQQVAV